MERNRSSTTGRSIREVRMVAREARRLVGLDRDRADGFGTSHRNWTRIDDCPSADAKLAKAVLRRAELVSAA